MSSVCGLSWVVPFVSGGSLNSTLGSSGASVFGQFDCGSDKDRIRAFINSTGRWKGGIQSERKQPCSILLFPRHLIMAVSQIEEAEVHLVLHIQNGLEPGASVWKSRRDPGHVQSSGLGFLILQLLIWWSAEHTSGWFRSSCHASVVSVHTHVVLCSQPELNLVSHADVPLCLPTCALTPLQAWFSISLLELVIVHQVVHAMSLGTSQL